MQVGRQQPRVSCIGGQAASNAQAHGTKLVGAVGLIESLELHQGRVIFVARELVKKVVHWSPFAQHVEAGATEDEHALVAWEWRRRRCDVHGEPGPPPPKSVGERAINAWILAHGLEVDAEELS